MKRFVFAITAATGAVLGVRVLRELAQSSDVHVVITDGSFGILSEEAGIDWAGDSEKAIQQLIRDYIGSERIFYYDENNFEAPVASGSFRTDGMFVVPCSMKTLSGIANGYANSLVERAADVTIKESRSLLLSPREMPFSAIHLENMLKLARLGVRIAPPVAGFYHKPGSLSDMVDFLAGKILDAMGVEHEIYRRWGSQDQF